MTKSSYFTRRTMHAMKTETSLTSLFQSILGSNDRKIQRQRGLTFIEIMVVLVIIGIISTFIGGRIFKAGDKAKAELTRTKMMSIKEPIYLYQMRNNVIPQDLRTAEVDDTKDAWGRDVQYRVMDGRSYELKSFGADGRDGGSGADADIVITGP